MQFAVRYKPSNKMVHGIRNGIKICGVHEHSEFFLFIIIYSLKTCEWQLEEMETIYRTAKMKLLISIEQFRSLKVKLNVRNHRYKSRVFFYNFMTNFTILLAPLI